MTVIIEDAPSVTDYVIPDADPEAPYGRFANGKPRKTPPKGTDVPRAKRASKAKSSAPDYRPALQGFAQIIAFATGFISPVNSYAIQMHSPTIVEEANTVAQHDMRFAAVLDKLSKTGPYGGLIMATIPLAVQLLHNAGRIPAQACIQMGGKSRERIEAEIDAHARAMGQQDAEVPSSAA